MSWLFIEQETNKFGFGLIGYDFWFYRTNRRKNRRLIASLQQTDVPLPVLALRPVAPHRPCGPAIRIPLTQKCGDVINTQ